MKSKFYLIFFLLFSPLSSQVVKLSIDKLDILEHSEHYGDEIYLHVLESHGENVDEVYFPRYPFYFRENHLENFEKSVLWERDVTDQEQLDLFISFIEKDAAPFDIDDLIGEIKLTLSNTDGKIKTQWDFLDEEGLISKVLSETGNALDLELSNDNGRYAVSLSLEII